MAKVIDVWAVHHWDGGDRTNFAYYLDQSAYSKGQLVELLPKTSCIESTTIVIFDSVEEVEASSIESARRSAYYKLTPLERLALKLERPPE